MSPIQKIVRVIFGLLIFFGVVALLHYLITILPIPAPYQGWTLLALHVMTVVALIGMLLEWAGYPVFPRNSPPT